MTDTIDTTPDDDGIIWTGTHYGRGQAPAGADSVAAVVATFRAVGGPARLVVDEDAGWVPADAPPMTDGPWDTDTGVVTDDAGAVRAWWAGYAGAVHAPDATDADHDHRAAASAAAGTALAFWG